MIGQISGNVPYVARGGAPDGLLKAKEAALQQQIDSKSAEQARTTCNDTASAIGKEIVSLRTQLAALEASETSNSRDNDTNSNAMSPSAAYSARVEEFGADDCSRCLGHV